MKKETMEIVSKSEITKSGKPIQRLSGKEYSPLILRRYSMPFLHWVCIITDDDLTMLDNIVLEFWEGINLDENNSIQDFRNYTGQLQDMIVKAFPRLEGCAVVFSADKMLISSLLGDFMVHEQCRIELYSLLNLSTQL